MTDDISTLELARLAGLPTADEEALYRFANLCVQKDRARHVDKNRDKDVKVTHELSQRVADMHCRVRALDSLIGAVTAYINQQEGDSSFINRFLSEHAAAKKKAKEKRND